jgi:hypothetical protein
MLSVVVLYWMSVNPSALSSSSAIHWGARHAWSYGNFGSLSLVVSGGGSASAGFGETPRMAAAAVSAMPFANSRLVVLLMSWAPS